jgi:hypothetical protein
LHFHETSPRKEANIVYAGAEAVAAATITLLFLLAIRLPEGQQGVFREGQCHETVQTKGLQRDVVYLG